MSRGWRAALFLILVIVGYVAAIWFYQAHGPQIDRCPPHDAANPWCPR